MTPLNASVIWLVAGLVLLVGEMLTTSFFLVFLALGAFAAALAASLGAGTPVQGALCAGVSVAGVLLLRQPIQRRLLLKSGHVGADVGREIQVDHPLAPHKQARITYQGTSWSALNVGLDEVHKGDRVKIVGIDGNTLLVKKVH